VAEKVTVELVDDLDGSPADEKVRFALGGSQYEIDLSSKNAEKLRAALKPYIDVARPPGSGAQSVARGPGRPKGATGKRASSGAAALGVDPKAVRVWADENNIDVPTRGRIPKPILDQYVAANPAS
jgi:hypothetical protein